jgi:hypothetical protein
MFTKGIDVVMAGTEVGFFVMSDIIDLVLFDELFGDDPRSFGENFIYPSAMSYGLNPDNDEGDREML